MPGLPAAGPYNYSDMTGQVLAQINQFGQWRATHDGGRDGTPWRVVQWDADEPLGSTVLVEARAADRAVDLAAIPFQTARNGFLISSGVTGRFIEVRVTMSREPGSGATPILYDLTLTAEDFVTRQSTELAVEFRNTSFDRENRRLLVQARARNTGAATLDAPIRMVVENLRDATITPANGDGFTQGGQPFFEFIPDGNSPLAPGGLTGWKQLIFNSPVQTRVEFERSWLVRANSPPSFFGAAPPTARVAEAYSYDADARDPDGHTVAYSLTEGPAGATISPAAGVVSWTPAPGQVGPRVFVVRAADDRGAATLQRFTVVVAGSPNARIAGPVVGPAQDEVKAEDR